MTTTEKHKHAKKNDYILPIAAILTVVIIANVSLAFQSNAAIDSKIKYAEDLAKPASIQITTISADCTGCFNTSALVTAIKQFKVTITENTLAPTSSEAKALIEKYNITRVPTMVVTGDTKKSGLDTVWNSVGTQESDGALILRIGAPFVDTASGETNGKADVILLNSSACSTCYSVSMHETVLKQMGVVVSNLSTVDISSAQGKALIAKYNITKVPTVLISPDGKYYDSLLGVWPQVGTTESDGWYVFRSMDAIQGAVYYDISLNKTMNQTI